MKRRRFFQSLAALAGAASISPNIFIPKFEAVRWKQLLPGKKVAVLNPAYEQAPYELLRMDPDSYLSVDLRVYPRGIQPHLPIRYSLIDPITYLPVVIPPFIQK
jgi:hypothetical protein